MLRFVIAVVLCAVVGYPAITQAGSVRDSATIIWTNGLPTCSAVDATGVTVADGSRTLLVQDNSSATVGAPASGYAKLYPVGGEWYMRSNTSGEHKILRDGTTVTAAQGGTGIASYTQGDMLYASGATTIAALAKGTTAQVIGFSSTIPTVVSPVTAAFDSTCDATGTFADNATVFTLADYDNTARQTLIVATISFTAVAAARTFTITAKMEGTQIGANVTCAAASGNSTSCTISVVDTTSAANRTYTITAVQSGGTTNTVDSCNVSRFSVLG